MHFENYENALSLLKTNKTDEKLRDLAIKYIINDMNSIIIFISEKIYINNIELIYVKDVYLNYGIVQNPENIKNIIDVIDNVDHTIIYQISKIFPRVAYEYITYVKDEVKRKNLINSISINFKISCDFLRLKSINTEERLMIVNEYMDDGQKLPDMLININVNDEARQKVFHILKFNTSWIKSYIINLDVNLFPEEKKYIYDNYQSNLFNRYSKNTDGYIEYCIMFRNCLYEDEIKLLIDKITNERINIGYVINIINNVNMKEDDRIKLQSMLLMDTLVPDGLSKIFINLE